MKKNPVELTTKEAAEILGVKPNTISGYISRGVVVPTRVGHVTKESVLKHKKNRNPGASYGGKVSRGEVSGARYINREVIERKIYGFTLWWFTTRGTPPTYEMLAAHIPLSKSGIHRYVENLIEAGKLERTDSRLYLKGLPEKIAQLVKEQYAKEIDAQAQLETDPSE